MPELTPAQQQAITTWSPDVLVIAGAGSGKTRTLTERIAFLLRNGVAASEIMVLTFTRKAAAEMIGRTRRLLEEGGDQHPEQTLRELTMGTFHSVGLGILRTFGARLGYHTADLTVADEDDCRLLIRQVARDLGFVIGEKWRAELSMDKIRKALENAYTTGRLDEDVHDPLTTDVNTILREYWQRLKAMNVLDFGLILLETQRLLRLPDVSASYNSIRHVLVDECQDLNQIQHGGFLDILCPPASFFGVGDRRQSIYAFRGARPDLMTERHPLAEIIDLQECFRCGRTIVAAANALIAVNADTLAKPMIAATGAEGRAETICGRSHAIAADLTWLHEVMGYAWSDIAVLARSHRTLKRLAGVLDELQTVPYYRVGGGFEVCETDEFRASHAALRLIANRRDNLAFLRLIEVGGIDSASYAMIRARAAADGVCHWDAAAGYMLRAWCAVIDELQEAETPGVLVGLDMLQQAGLPVPWHVNAYWATYCRELNVTDALRWHALRDQTDDLRSGNHVTLATAHAAKGLEWPCVIVANMLEGDFPSSQAIKAEGVHEERRLAYVAMTRAKEHLALHYRRPEDQAEQKRIQAPSRFIAEAGLTIDATEQEGSHAG